MGKKVFIFLFVFFAALVMKAQELSGYPAVVTVIVESNEPIITIRGIRNYNIYSITVDTVLCINVCEEFEKEFSKQYLLSCKYLTVCLDSSKYTQPKVDWYPNTKYTIGISIGFGIGDLDFYKVLTGSSYLADPYSIKLCSWPKQPESIYGRLFMEHPENRDKNGALP